MEDCRTSHHVPCFVGGGFQREKRKIDGIAALLFILANIGVGFLPWARWVRYGVSAFAIMGYVGIRYKKQIGKAVFVMLAFYNHHCLGYLMASSIYEKAMSIMIWRKRRIFMAASAR